MYNVPLGARSSAKNRVRIRTVAHVQVDQHVLVQVLVLFFILPLWRKDDDPATYHRPVYLYKGLLRRL